MHLDGGVTDEQIDSIKENVERYGQLPLYVHFTEITVTCEKEEDSDECKDSEKHE